jgi:hypothetical protein
MAEKTASGHVVDVPGDRPYAVAVDPEWGQAAPNPLPIGQANDLLRGTGALRIWASIAAAGLRMSLQGR